MNEKAEAENVVDVNEFLKQAATDQEQRRAARAKRVVGRALTLPLVPTISAEEAEKKAKAVKAPLDEDLDVLVEETTAKAKPTLEQEIAEEVSAELKEPKRKSKPTPDFSLRPIGFNDGRPPIEKAIAALQSFSIPYSYDAFHDRYLVGDHVLRERVADSVEKAILYLRVRISKLHGWEPKPETIKSAVIRLCLEHSFNPVLDYLDSLVWDGKPRIDTWLTTYFGAVDDPLTRAEGRKTLIAAVRRARKPGTKFDPTLVLEGPGGTGKSTALKNLFGEGFFCDQTIIGEGSLKQQELCRGVWGYELQELEGLSEHNISRVKTFQRKCSDRARPAYARELEDIPRTCIFIATTNETDYLVDDSANNRTWWPVRTAFADFEGIARDRDQLWAEAAMAEKTGETLVIDEALWGIAADRARERIAPDPWEDAVVVAENLPVTSGYVAYEWTPEGVKIKVRSEYIFTTLLKFPTSVAKTSDGRRLAKIMKRLGWNGPDVLNIDGTDKRTYWKIKKGVTTIPAATTSTLPILDEKLGG